MFDTEHFLHMLVNTDTGNMLFNPYAHFCVEHDYSFAPFIRKDNLRLLLHKIDQFDTILVGEAPGHLGCRKTGIAFTDELTLSKAGKIYNIDEFDTATLNGNSKEASATFMWKVLEKLKNPPLMWNIIPFHPHEKDKPLSNRTPNRDDYHIAEDVINYFFNTTKFKKYFAIGRHAEKYLKKLGLNPIYIRHPSHGGSNEFKEGMYKYFEVKEK